MTHKHKGQLGIIELFAGAGGLAQGFVNAGGYELLALSDIERSARSTFTHNYPDIPYIQTDIKNLDVRSILRIADGRTVHGILGGPPCQGFSLAGSKNSDDARNLLVGEYVAIAKALKPGFLLIENVPQMLFHLQFETLLSSLTEDYAIRYGVLNAANYGVPQTRHRMFLIAYRKDLEIEPTLPDLTHDFVDQEMFDYVSGQLRNPQDDRTYRTRILGADPVTSQRLGNLLPSQIDPVTPHPIITVWDAISDLASDCEGYYDYATEPETSIQQRLRNGSDRPLNHAPRRHAAAMLSKTQFIGEGQDLRAISQDQWPKSHYSQAYGRLHRRGLARTITTFFCNPGSGRFLHPLVNRTITIREAARLQGFPDTFEFIGNQSEQMKLIGNAVPPPLAEIIARHIQANIGDLLQ